ncbi:MAG: amino acid ABC transporter permease [Chloroflexota bacterium]
MGALVDTLRGTFSQRFGSSGSKRINWQYLLQDNLTGSWYLTVWVVALTLGTAIYTSNQLDEASNWTTTILLVWGLGILSVVVGELFGLHTIVSRWLKENLFSSISNIVLTLLLVLFLASLFRDMWSWAYVNASFDPDKTLPEFRQEGGATWGVISGSSKLWSTGLLDREHTWRVWASVWLVLGLSAVSFASSREALKSSLGWLNRITNILWLVAPFILYIFLAGVSAEGPFINFQTLLIGEAIVLAVYLLLWWQKVIKFTPINLAIWLLVWPLAYIGWQAIGRSELFVPINVDNWGGFLLTMVMAVAVNFLSFPIGLMLALGRRSDVNGIPNWIVWPVAIGSTAYFLSTSTPELWETSRNVVESLLALWPLLIVLIAYLFQRFFKGNVVAAASTSFIEFVRGVPLITILFMAIVMAPFFLEEGATFKRVWAVIIGFTVFSAAYMAETIRGGLQAIPRGQYEAADAIGLNSLQKMRFIILPQALRLIIPALVGQFIGTYKTSSLVAIVGLFELTGITRSIAANGEWLGLRTELYVFIAIVYFFGSAMMSWYSRRLEERLGVGER